MIFRKTVERAAIFGPGLVLPAAAWEYLRERSAVTVDWTTLTTASPMAWAVLTAAVIAGLVIIPALLLLFLLLPRTPAGALVPRRWRKRYRRWRKNTSVDWLREDREHQHSSYIPAWLHSLVIAADRHRCVACGSRLMLQADHVFPWSQGGLTALLNLVALCRDCNVRIKSNYWPGVYYRGAASPGEAALVLGEELRYLHNPLRITLRLTRAAWALAA